MPKLVAALAVLATLTVLAPKLAAFEDEITQNTALFTRIAAVYKHRATAEIGRAHV